MVAKGALQSGFGAMSLAGRVSEVAWCDIICSGGEDMTLREEIARGENVALEFKEARPKASFKRPKAVVVVANGRSWHTVFGISRQFE